MKFQTKWLIRTIGAVLLAVIGLAGIWLYGRMKPEEVRAQVLARLQEKFQGAEIEVGSARLRLVGDIVVSELRIIRRGDPNRTPILYVSEAIVRPDKAELANGRVAIRKVELNNAHIRLERDTQKKWNWEGIKPVSTSDHETSPAILLRNTKFEIIDRAMGSTPVFEAFNIEGNILNNPSTVMDIDVNGSLIDNGFFQIKAKIEKGVGASFAGDIQGITLGPKWSCIVGEFSEEASEFLNSVSGKIGIKGQGTWRPNRKPEIGYETTVTLTHGRISHPDLPENFDNLAGVISLKDGEIKVNSLTGNVRGAKFSASLDIDPPIHGEYLRDFEHRIKRVSTQIEGLAFSEELLTKFGRDGADIYRQFQPNGLADVRFDLERTSLGVSRKVIVKPKGLKGLCEDFKYPVEDVVGTVEYILDDGKPQRFNVDLSGTAKGKPVTLKGRIIGKPRENDIDLVLTGQQIVLDETLLQALEPPYPKFIQSLNASATGDVVARIRHNETIRKDHGPTVFDNEFDIRVVEGKINYDEFPYPLSELRGEIYIRTVPPYPTSTPGLPGQPPQAAIGEIGSLEFKNFTARGPNGTRLKINGSKKPATGGMILAMRIDAEGLNLDRNLYKALSAINMTNSWNLIEPTGRMNATIDVRIHDRQIPGEPSVPINPAKDIELAMALSGLTVKPTFFPYRLTDVAGKIAFRGGKVDLVDFTARHNQTKLELPRAEIRLPQSGGYYASLNNLYVESLFTDHDLLAALPKKLQDALSSLDINGPITVKFSQLIVSNHEKDDVRPATPIPASRPGSNTKSVQEHSDRLPVIYWKTTVNLFNNSLNTGIPWTNVTGQISSEGIYERDKLGVVKGTIGIDRALILKQPFEMVSAEFGVDPNRPDIIMIENITARLYGGRVTGESRIQIASPVRFDLVLTGTRLRLEEFAKINKLGKAQLEGLATAKIVLGNPIDPITKVPLLSGSGSIDIPNGKLLDLPIILDVLKLARLRPMDQTGFEEAHAVFAIRGDRIRFGQLDLLGNAVSLGGEGEMRLDGSDAKFEFYTVWTNIRNIMGISGELPARLSGSLFKIKVQGDLGGGDVPKPVTEPLPIITEPIKRLVQRRTPK